ncbi:ubiquinol-cytochrome C chaperone family protein [Jiella sonneratiae]|uniref:Ubiquinol-cytochrome c chaperone domain-containing protein n=1 Tax=Jiella sonneratiae TaxID=2816856 RepID=A0ABS3J2C9_9HYPH|nr:ubiquinol-cytochrome C chaperone family protein [Jiella sonneratiae]MBO0903824.1 hypothetical protein [Jiella sonneratiae]
MLNRWRIARRNRAIVEDIYQALVAAARRPALYERCGIEDSFSGRFEALGIHVFLFLRRCRGAAGLEPVAQDVVDRFMADLDSSIRELGVGDQSVPKRMRRLAGIFYERVEAYDAALAAGGDAPGALATALKGRAIDEVAPGDAAEALATYMRQTGDRMRAIDDSDVLAGKLELGDR